MSYKNGDSYKRLLEGKRNLPNIVIEIIKADKNRINKAFELTKENVVSRPVVEITTRKQLSNFIKQTAKNKG
jgi:hypothetical protein